MDLTAVQTAITAAIADVNTLAVAVLGALAVMWGIRKLIKTTNRS